MSHGDVSSLLKVHGYTQLQKIGEGSFGKALLVQSTDSSKLVCKMVDVSKASSKEVKEAQKESTLLAQLSHPYIVRYRESFTERGWLCILMDYCEGGDLSKQIVDARKARKTLPEEQNLKWFTQAILALQYIHERHILHRDLKPGNFFMTKHGVMKMGDFGIAKVLACTIAVARTQIGTPYYLSPELCQEKPYTWPSDIWAMGCILFELCALKVPFDGPNIPQLVQKIVKGAVPAVPPAYSAFLRNLTSELLNKIPEKRPSTDEILKRPPIKALMRQMLDELPLGERGAEGDDAAGEREAMPAQRPSVAASVVATPVAGGGEYKEHAGNYKRDDLVEYLSSAHKSWLPAKVMNTDAAGRIIIDLKPNTWIPPQEQAAKVRPRDAPAPAYGGPRGASPMMRRSPSVGSNAPNSARGASPMARQSPRAGPGVGPRAASPMIRRSPSVGSAAGASPMSGRPSSNRGRSPSVGSLTPSAQGSGAPSWSTYKVGDMVEYHSSSHKDWLPATITKVDAQGRVIIDLKPNTWMTKEEQATKIRPRRMAPAPQSGSRCASPMRRQSSVDRVGLTPGYASPGGGVPRAMTPSYRAPSPSGRVQSPSRALSRDRPSSRAASPSGRYAADSAGYGVGTPRMGVRPPGIPRVGAGAASPLRSGGRSIAGM